MASVIIGIVLSPVVVHSLGNNLYGIWTIIVAFSGYYGLVNLGISPAVSYYLSHHYARGEYEQINKIASTAFFVLILLSFFILIISIAIGFAGGKIFLIAEDNILVFRMTVFIMAINFALGFVFAPLQSVLITLQRYDLRNANQIFFDVSRSIIIYIALSLGYKVVALSIITCFFTLLNNISFGIIVNKIFPELKLKFSYASKNVLKKIANYGSLALLSELGRQLIFYSASFIIGIFLEVQFIAFYAIAGNLVEYARNLIGAMTRVFFPVVAQKYSRSEFKELQELYIEGTKYAFSISVIIIAGLLFMGKQFIILWMGNDYVKCYNVLMVLCIGYLPFFLSYVANQILLGTKKMIFVAKVNCICAVLNILFGIILIKYKGIIGVAFGLSIALMIQSFWFLIKCNSILNITVIKFFQRSFLRPIISAVPIVVIGYYMRERWFANSWSEFIIQACFLTICYFLMFFLLCMNKKHRQYIFHRFKIRFS